MGCDDDRTSVSQSVLYCFSMFASSFVIVIAKI